jgi:cytochrome P450
LLHHPDTLQALRRDPELGAAVVEETLRYDAPVQTAGRIASEPITLGALEIERGDVIALLLAAANRDPAAYPDPDRFDPHRAEAEVGAHAEG